MKKEDILNLASLSRIRITDEEAETLRTDVDAVLAYVSVINEITTEGDLTKKVGVRYNVFREDEAKTLPDEHTETLLSESPVREGRFLKVKKILQQD